MLLHVNAVSKQYTKSGAKVLDNISFDVQEGELFTLLGASGCGKTTMLRLIAGFESLDTGKILLQDRILATPQQQMRPEERGVGFVFQDYALFPHLNVLHNITFGLKGLNRKARYQRAMELLDMMDMQGLEKRMPHQLSGGQQQRVALARSLAPGPRLLLMDEPFSNLDATLRAETREEVRNLLKEIGASAILVTHDREEAFSVGDRIGVMAHGRLIQTGTPEEVYYHPTDPFVASFLGQTNLLAGAAQGRIAHTCLGPMELDSDCNGNVTLSLRPEHLQLCRPSNGECNGVIVRKHFRGHEMLYCVRCEAQEFAVRAQHNQSYQMGDKVVLRQAAPGVVVQGQTQIPV